MSSYGSKLIFPLHFVEGVTAGGEANTDITEASGREQVNSIWSKRRRVIDLEGITMLQWQQEEFDRFQDYTMGMAETFLFMDISRRRMRDEQIGIGDGIETEFQLQVARSIQNKTLPALKVLWPDHDYPPQYFRNGDRPVLSWPRDGADGYVHIFIDGEEINRSEWSLERENSGMVTFDVAPANGAAITATGFFYTLVRFTQDRLPAKALGGGKWVISSGGVIEPKGAEG